MKTKFNVINLILLVTISSVTNGQECDLNILKTTPNLRFIDNNDGTVTDKWTNLMWKQCIEGQFSDGANGCTSDTPLRLNWQNSLKQAGAVNAGSFAQNRGYGAWRLPNVKELESIIERHCINPSINESLFPNTPSSTFWSSTTYFSPGSSIWHVTFNGGYISTNGMEAPANVRLVRDL